MFKAIFECVGPVELQGMSHFENYVVGSDEQPLAIVAGAMGTRSFKKLCKASQVPPNNDIVVLLASLENSDLLLSIVEYTETQEGQYKGTKRNRVTGYFRVGERQIGIAPAAGQPGQTSGPAMAGQAAMAPPPQNAPPTQPAQPMQAPPAQPTAPPTQQQPAPMAPPDQQAQVGPMLRCTICNQDVSAMAFGMHVARHQSEPGWNGIG
jgi:hypothetical protein